MLETTNRPCLVLLEKADALIYRSHLPSPYPHLPPLSPPHFSTSLQISLPIPHPSNNPDHRLILGRLWHAI